MDLLLLLRTTPQQTEVARLLGEEPVPVVGQDPDTGDDVVVGYDHSGCRHWELPGDLVCAVDVGHRFSAAELAQNALVKLTDVPDADSAALRASDAAVSRLDVAGLKAAAAKDPVEAQKLDDALTPGKRVDAANAPALSWADVKDSAGERPKADAGEVAAAVAAEAAP